MAAEFYFVIDLLRQKPEISQLLAQLQTKEEECITKVRDLYRDDETIKLRLIDECRFEQQQFDKYYEQYRQQTVKSMTDICYKMLHKLNESDYTTSKQQCIETQIKNGVVFQQNVQNKLMSYL